VGQLVDLFSIGCAFKARALCNGIFISDLTRREIEQADAGGKALSPRRTYAPSTGAKVVSRVWARPDSAAR
jgi:hypothetical protein